jgi:hypothetical protein
VAAVIQKYRLLDHDGGNINELNAQLRSKYAVDLTASVAEIQKTATKPHAGAIFQPPSGTSAAQEHFASQMSPQRNPADDHDTPVASLEQFAEYAVQGHHNAAGYDGITPDPGKMNDADASILTQISSARPSDHPPEPLMLSSLRSVWHFCCAACCEW